MELTKALRLEIGGMRPPVVSFVGGGGKTSSMYRLSGELRARGVRMVCTSTTRLAAYEVESTQGVVEVIGSSLPYDAVGRALDEYGQCLLVTPEIVEGGMQKYPGVEPSMVDALVGRAGALGIGAVIVEADGAKMLPLKAPLSHEPPLPSTTTVLAPFAGMDALGRLVSAEYIHRSELVRAVLGMTDSENGRITPAMVARLLTAPQGGKKNCPSDAAFIPVLNKAEAMPARAGARLAARLMAEQDIGSLVASTGCAACEAVHERWGPTAAVVLAAGEGSRFGAPKQLVEVDGAPLVVRAIRCALDSGVNQVVVVTGAHASPVEACVQSTYNGIAQVKIVRNPRWESGQSSSMHAGLRALGDEVQAAVLMAADQPNTPVSLLARLCSAWRIGWDIAAPQVDGVIRGAPALFDRCHWPELLQVQGDRGGRDLLRRFKEQVKAVSTDSKALVDIDTYADLGHRLS